MKNCFMNNNIKINKMLLINTVKMLKSMMIHNKNNQMKMRSKMIQDIMMRTMKIN